MTRYLKLQEAAAALPVPASQCTVWRWCTKGFYIKALQKTFRLQHIHVGRKVFTTRAWMDEFIAELTAARALDRERRATRNPRKWERIIQLYQVEAVLRRAGI